MHWYSAFSFPWPMYSLVATLNWSDVVWPWCYIGKRRFETALTRFNGAADVEVSWHAFQLNPAQPRGVRTTHDEYLRDKIGGSLEQVQVRTPGSPPSPRPRAPPYDFERYQVINTFDAHRVAHLGRVHGLGTEIQEQFLLGSSWRARSSTIRIRWSG